MERAIIWSREEERAFENAIATHWLEEISQEQWEKIASMVPSKDIEEVKRHYEVLVEDVNAIESGQVPIPCYVGEEPITTSSLAKDFHDFIGSPQSEKKPSSSAGNGFSGMSSPEGSSGGHDGKGGSSSDQERRKGVPWTEEEHRLFLLGLNKFGKGDWKSISRNFVISRTPTQVASHAQKYFIRLNSMTRDRRRSSIHDITSVNNQSQVTGQQPHANPSAVAAMGQPVTKHRAAHPPPVAGIGMYGGAPLGHPVAAPPSHMGSAIGTPVILHHLGHHHHHPQPPYVVPVAAYPIPPPPTMH